MKLQSLWISEYKNVKDLTIQFESDLISLLVGRNGLGKSNLIEILALIFRDLDMLNDEEDFKDWSYDKNHFSFKIEYECKNSALQIRCEPGEFEVKRKQKGSSDDYETLTFKDFQRNKKEEYLPKYIIGYYSGENKRIREIIRPYEESVWSHLKNNKELEKGLRPLFFAENHHALLVLLTVLLYRFDPPSVDFKDRLDYLIKEFTSFSELEEFTLILKHPEWYRRDSKEQRKLSIELIESNILAKKEEKPEFPFWGAKGKAHKIISFFYDNNQEQPTYYYEEEDKTEYLELSLDKDKVATKVAKAFGHPANFMDALDTLYAIDSIHKIALTVKSVKRETSFDFSSLSEGEQQLITVLGLILITGQEDCLFLLDEPDTHLNPRWQRRYVELLRKFNLNDENSHIVVATHSPLLVQAAEGADVVLFKIGESGKVEVDYHDTKVPNWRIDHVLMSKYFGLESSRPRALDELMRRRKEIIQKGELSAQDKIDLQQYENEIGYLPTGETIKELESMLFINRMAEQLKQ